MATFAESIATHNTSVFFNTAHFAEVVLRYTGGNPASASEVTVVATWFPAEVNSGRGRATTQRGELLVSASDNITEADSFLIGGNRVEVVATPGPKQHGMQTVQVTQYIPETKGANSIRTGDI